jgi:flagellar protein FliO/FliZ
MNPDMLASAWKMFTALTIVVAVLLLTFYASRRLIGARSGGFGSETIRVLASSSIGLKKAVALVEIPGEILVVAVTADAVRLLSRIEDPDRIRRIKAGYKQPAGMTFSRQLQKFALRVKRTGDEN